MLSNWSSAHPVLKIAVCVNVMCIGMWGPITSCILICVAAFPALIFGRRCDSVAISPWLALVFCALSVAIVIPGSRPGEITDAAFLAIRLLEIMLVSAVFGRVFEVDDLLVLKSSFRIPWQPIMAMIVVSRFIPVSLQSMRDVLIAQRARGLRLRVATVFNASTYHSLLIPYLLSIFREAMTLWVSLHLRPYSEFPSPHRKVRLVDVAIFMLTVPLWYDVASLFFA